MLTLYLHVHVAVGFLVLSARGNSLILEGMKRSYIYRCLEDETLCIKSDGKECMAIEHGRLSSYCLKLGSQLREEVPTYLALW